MTSIPRPRTTELPFEVAGRAGAGAGDGGRGWETTGGSAGKGVSVGIGGGATGGGVTRAGCFSTISLAAPDPFFFTGFFPFPWRGRALGGNGALPSVSLTSLTSASDMNGLAIVATMFGYFRAAAVISETWPDIITIGIRAVGSVCDNRSQT